VQSYVIGAGAAHSARDAAAPHSCEVNKSIARNPSVSAVSNARALWDAHAQSNPKIQSQPYLDELYRLSLSKYNKVSMYIGNVYQYTFSLSTSVCLGHVQRLCAIGRYHTIPYYMRSYCQRGSLKQYVSNGVRKVVNDVFVDLFSRRQFGLSKHSE
jgi:hypothetical protein